MSAVSEIRAPVVGTRRWLPDGGRGWLIPLLVALGSLGLALSCHAYHPNAFLRVILIGAGALVLFGICGDALAVALVPAAWRTVRPFLSLAFGATASGLVLMAFGWCHVPLHISLWLTLVLGLFASWWVRRLNLSRPAVPLNHEMLSDWEARPVGSWVWMAVLALLFLVVLIPAWRTGDLTIYGENPDSSQVVGIAVLFQHVPPTHTDFSLPLDTVPQEWRFRYPIFYPLAALADLVHADPIRVFPVIAALLVVMAALGFGLVAVRCFRAPAWAGPVVAALIGFTWILQYLAWHPYWNQLWGTALMPYTILFGWQALERRDGRSGLAAVLLLMMLWFAYPLALPYPLVVLAGVLVAHWHRPRRPTISSWRGWLAAVVLLAILAPAVIGSVLKLKEAIVQLVTPGSALWGGDITRYVSFGQFAGTGGGAVAAALVLIVAAYGLWRLPRRVRVCLGVVLAALLLLDLRFRLTASGTYMDFKHLSFVGLIVLTLAASGGLARLAAPGAWRASAALALVVWCGAALVLDHRDAISQGEQVTPQLFQIRQWAAALPAGASVRVDIPPQYGGQQLWAVYMLGSHPVDAPRPLLDTTYAHAVPGVRADFALSVSNYPSATGTGRPYPAQFFAVNPPVQANHGYVLRRVAWPKRYDNVMSTASTYLEP